MSRVGGGGSPGQPAERRVLQPSARPGSAPRTAACPALPAGGAGPRGAPDRVRAGHSPGNISSRAGTHQALQSPRCPRYLDGSMFLRMLRPAPWERRSKIHLGFVCLSQATEGGIENFPVLCLGPKENPVLSWSLENKIWLHFLYLSWSGRR